MIRSLNKGQGATKKKRSLYCCSDSDIDRPCSDCKIKNNTMYLEGAEENENEKL